MKCDEVSELLPLFVYGDLEPNEQVDVDTHLSGCAHCRHERAALAIIREGLDQTPLPSLAVRSLPTLPEADRFRRVAGRWRAASLLAVAVGLLLLLVRLEVQVGNGAITVRWGDPPPAAAEAQAIIERKEVGVPTSVEERLDTLSELVHALASNVDRLDHRQREQVARFQRDLQTFRLQHHQRLAETERDVSALYTAQFGSRPAGVNP